MDRLEKTWRRTPKECICSVSNSLLLDNCILFVEIEMFLDPVRRKTFLGGVTSGGVIHGHGLRLG